MFKRIYIFSLLRFFARSRVIQTPSLQEYVGNTETFHTTSHPTSTPRRLLDGFSRPFCNFPFDIMIPSPGPSYLFAPPEDRSKLLRPSVADL